MPNNVKLYTKCLVGSAVRKQGFTEENYLSPLTKKNGRK